MAFLNDPFRILGVDLSGTIVAVLAQLTGTVGRMPGSSPITWSLSWRRSHNITFAPVHETPHARTVWDFRNADWEQLNNAFHTTNWTDLISTRNADDATQALTDHITSTAQKFIPMRTLHSST